MLTKDQQLSKKRMNKNMKIKRGKSFGNNNHHQKYNYVPQEHVTVSWIMSSP